jgi:hypothetical protein
MRSSASRLDARYVATYLYHGGPSIQCTWLTRVHNRLCFYSANLLDDRRPYRSSAFPKRPRFSSLFPPRRPKSPSPRSTQNSPSLVNLMWATPIYQRKVDIPDLAKLNTELSKLALAEYRRFQEDPNKTQVSPSLSSNATSPPQRSGSGVRRNEEFFEWQRRIFEASGETKSVFDGHPAFETLKRQIADSYADFVRKLGIERESISEHEPQESALHGTEASLNKTQSQSQGVLETIGIRPASSAPRIFCWAGIHSNGASHPPHLHPGCMLSGVYYARVCEGAGDITFEDPRGPRPPFHEKFTHRSTEGGMLLFPGWLTHYVTPTWTTTETRGIGDNKKAEGAEASDLRSARIAFSFNIDGHWEETSNIGIRVE